ncbi:MAG: FAD-binding oxidoreductase [Nitrospirales bacterium]|nr:FAD-binding oxidoreductase [Nitrospirales bacterium]MDR4484040.1 FAD-binding oxidoreductase [Nitrospirales bacterium]
MTPRHFRAKVLCVRQLTQDVRELTLALVDIPRFVFLPGQSIALTIPDAASGLSFLRYYSLVSLPSSSHQLVLLFNAGEKGKGATFALEHLVGEELECSGPFGSFHLHEDSERDLLFIGTGTGIAPLWSMLSSLFEQSCSQSMTLLWGLRSESDIYYLDELQKWADCYKNFSFILTLSQPAHHWRGKRGRVTHLLQEFSHVDHLAVYVCGNRKMVAEVTGLLQCKGMCPVYRERHHEGK